MPPLSNARTIYQKGEQDNDRLGLALKSHDPSQRANGFLTLAGGIIITFAREILTLITG